MGGGGAKNFRPAKGSRKFSGLIWGRTSLGGHEMTPYTPLPLDRYKGHFPKSKPALLSNLSILMKEVKLMSNIKNNVQIFHSAVFFSSEMNSLVNEEH